MILGDRWDINTTLDKVFSVETKTGKDTMKLTILPFAPNRVLRLYLGGSGIDRLCHAEPAVDNRFPENWIASCIEGNGRAYHSPGHGISKILFDGEWKDFPVFLASHGREMLGEKHLRKYGAIPAVLVKLLDSAEQLPLQVHPTQEDARKYLNSDYGKTEAWIVLGTRKVNDESPYLLVGFNERLNREIFIQECLAGKLEQGLGMLNRIEVTAGDVIIIRGGVPHAIGPGMTMVEIMEPSDWVIIPEIACCGVDLNEKQRFMGIAPETAVGMFDFTVLTPKQIRARYSPVPMVLEENASGCLRSLISQEECALFSAVELQVNGKWELANPDSFGIGIVVDGKLDFDGIELSAGGNFFLPYALKQVTVEGKGHLILIRPPKS